MKWGERNATGANPSAVVFLGASVSAQTGLAQSGPGLSRPSHSHPVVQVSIPDWQRAVLPDGVVVQTSPVSVGAANSPSPVRNFQMVSHVAHPSDSHSGTVIPSVPNNPLGPRSLGRNFKGYGIHGTNQPRSIGKAASRGCIRLSHHDIVEPFPLLAVGDTVESHAQRDPLVREMFGADDHLTRSHPHLVALRNQSHTR